MKCTLLASLAALTVLTSSAFSQGSWSEEFDQPGLLGRVFGIGKYQGDIVAGGYGVQGDGHANFGLAARFDGTHWQPLGTGISGGSLQFVADFVEYGGALIAGGRFCCAGGVSTANIARWDGTQWSALGSGIAGIVHTMTVYQGDLYVGGEFTSAGGVPAINIARWNGSTWQAVGGGLDKPYDPEVHDLMVGADNKLYASGEFDTAGGIVVNNVAVWDGASWSAMAFGLPGSLNARVYALAWYQGKVYAGGNYDLVFGYGGDEKVAVWDGSSWTPAGVFPDGTIIGTIVRSLEVVGTDLYAGGNIVEVNGVPLDRLARFDGSQWHAAGGVAGSDVETLIYAMTEHNGKLVVGGEFSRVGNAFAPGEPIVCHSVGSYDGANWEGVGVGLGLSGGITGAVLWNGGLVAVGSCIEAGSQYVRGSNGWPGPLFFDGTDWSSMADVYGQVRTVLVWNNELIIAGSFTQVAGQPISGVARFDGTQWTGFGSGFTVSADRAALAVYQGQLYAGGTGGVQRWNGTSWENFAAQLFGHVSALHVHQNVLYIGGSISGNLVSWDGTTQQTVGGTSGSVSALESYQGNLLAGGWFGLDSWDGNSLTPFPGINGPLVSALTIFQGELYAAGNLIVPGLPPNKYMARWSGSTWEAVGGGVDGNPVAMVGDDLGGHLYVGGAMAHAEGHPSRWFARWDTTPLAIGSNFCQASANSVSAGGAQMTATGSASVSANDLVLTCGPIDVGQPGIFFYGSTQLNGGSGLPFGEGVRCAGGTVLRILPPTTADASGNLTVAVDNTLLSGIGITALSVQHFQGWYRDPAGGDMDGDGVNEGFNLTDGLSITFEP